MGSITRTFANQIKTGGKLDADGLDLTDTFAFTGTVTGAGGITEADQWRLTANITTQGDITSNLERNDSVGFGYIGTGMTESSGIFTFPSTGIWKVSTTIRAYSSVADTVSIEIQVTTDNSSYSVVADAAAGDNATSKAQTGTVSTFVDVTDTSNVKVKFRAGSLSAGTNIEGTTSYNKTVFEFIRLGDT